MGVLSVSFCTFFFLSLSSRYVTHTHTLDISPFSIPFRFIIFFASRPIKNQVEKEAQRGSDFLCWLRCGDHVHFRGVFQCLCFACVRNSTVRLLRSLVTRLDYEQQTIAYPSPCTCFLFFFFPFLSHLKRYGNAMQS